MEEDPFSSGASRRDLRLILIRLASTQRGIELALNDPSLSGDVSGWGAMRLFDQGAGMDGSHI
jgi:hypothetical protein